MPQSVPERCKGVVQYQVMAPVRETAAQAVGAAMQPLSACSAQALLGLLHQLIKQQQWDVRHGGLLGLKYLLAARPQDSQALMPQALPAAVLGLQVRHAAPWCDAVQHSVTSRVLQVAVQHTCCAVWQVPASCFPSHQGVHLVRSDS